MQSCVQMARYERGINRHRKQRTLQIKREQEIWEIDWEIKGVNFKTKNKGNVLRKEIPP